MLVMHGGRLFNRNLIMVKRDETGVAHFIRLVGSFLFISDPTIQDQDKWMIFLKTIICTFH